MRHPQDRTARPSFWRVEAGPLLIVVFLAGLFFLSYFNRFLGLRSGDGEFAGGMSLLAGWLPYRDYYTAGPPLNQLKSALELLIFGKALIVTRIAAVVERLCIAVLLYVWLRRSFSSLACMLASGVTIIVSAGDRTDPLASYNHDAILFAMICGYAACVSLGSPRVSRAVWWAAIAGAGAGLSSLSKQTVGLGVAVAVLTIAVLCCITERPLMLIRWVAAYLIGFAAPVLCVALVLRRLGVLGIAFRMLFISGPSAKAGHPFDFVWRTVYIGRDNAVWVTLGVAAVALSAGAIRRGLIGTARHATAPSIARVSFLVLLSGIALAGLAEVLSRLGIPAIWNFSKGAVYYTFVGTTCFGIVLIWRGLLGTTGKRRAWELAIIAVVGWAVAFTLSLSWPAFEAMALPGLGLLIAAAVDGARAYRPAVYALLAVLVWFQAREKLDLPFTFDYQDEPPVRLAVDRSANPLLRGMRLPAATVRLVDAVTRTAGTAAPKDTMFTYPEMGILYTLAGRYSPTHAGSHNIDVVPDWLAREDAQRLLEAPPAVIVYARPREAQLLGDEKIWRDGRPSGQRAIISVLDQLASKYKPAGEYLMKEGDNPIRLYVRP